MFPILFRQIRRSFAVVVALALLGGYAVQDVLSHWHGMPDYALPIIGGCDAGANLQDECHHESSASTVIHVYIASAQVYAGSTDTLRISVANPYPLDIAAGFDIAVDTPAMLDTVPGMNTILTLPNPPYSLYPAWSVTHSQPQFFQPNTDSAIWTMLYTARPMPGIDTIYAAGNAVNGDSASADVQDHWDSITVYVTVLPAPSIVTPSSSGNLLQVYPNPAANVLFINDGIPADVGTYTVMDAAGRVVLRGRQIPLDGRQSIDISGIAAGAYIISIQPRMGQAITRKIAIQR